jgi:glycosidase
MTPDARRTTDYFPLGLQISAHAWDDCDLSLELFAEYPSAPLYPLRQLASRLRQKAPERPASAGRLNLLALLNAAFRIVAGRYVEQRRCSIGLEAVELAGRHFPLAPLRPTLEAFVRHYPPLAVRQGMRRDGFLRGQDAPAGRRSAVVELFILAVQTLNPAAHPLSGLFDDAGLQRECDYRETLRLLDHELAGETVPGLIGGSLLARLREPLQASPESLEGQLDYVRQHWAGLLPPEFLRRMLSGIAVLREEEQLRGGGGPGPAHIPRFAAAGDEPERFSPDTDWMPNVVLIAKTIYVWLDQLSSRYGRPIERLDQIPGEELDRLGRWGFTALWLIGIWERSVASAEIKQRMGNPEAVASAYSLYDYAVAADLGGEAALHELEERCRARGIRLACDVVPNHTGIYSRWTREHPDWYVQVEHPPYPAYRYSGPNLSRSDDVEIVIEDGYWNHADAAVVFRHVERGSGRVRYIYHGNDGTHLPWNDTAQLNFLLPEVREAMIRTIVEVARRFRIIRFDAAMTLAKKHFQRLWFPLPGGGAGVPSRAEHALEAEAFEAAFPVEFWREVVDRVAAEVPDTLLLAEAFWLMEGYFVRTLGMHRVYNSAFMNMLKMEENAKYRTVIKNVLEFNHEILKRFVNFMNNPDEATAVAQFGKTDKYFGVAVLLVTLPGLPMIGHGQVEGFEEKYGMEYRRAYWNETPDEGFIAHHEAQVFPLMRRRHLFSGSADFVLYDFWSSGHVNEDVFAYSNRTGAELALVVYHNRFADTGGWIRESAAKMQRDAGGEHLRRSTLAAALSLRGEPGVLYRFRDHCSGLEYLRAGRELAEQGLYLPLGPYQYYVLLDWREIVDTDGSWTELAAALGGQAVADLESEWKRRRYAPLHEALRRSVDSGLLARVGHELLPVGQEERPACELFGREVAALASALAHAAGLAEPETAIGDALAADLAALESLLALAGQDKRERAALAALRCALPAASGAGADSGLPEFCRVFLPWLALRRLGELGGPQGAPARTAAWLEEYLLRDILCRQLRLETDEQTACRDALLVAILCRHQGAWRADAEETAALHAVFADPQTRELLGWHPQGDGHYIVREPLESLLCWLYFITAIDAVGEAGADTSSILSGLAGLHDFFSRLQQKAAEAHYQVEKLSEFV